MKHLTQSDLVYAASARCFCGARLAYNRNLRAHRVWMCSALLLEEEEPETKHTDPLPYAKYKILSELQTGEERKTTQTE